LDGRGRRASRKTPDTQAAEYGSGNLLALAVWAVQHVKNKITDHALELARRPPAESTCQRSKSGRWSKPSMKLGANCMRSIR